MIADTIIDAMFANADHSSIRVSINGVEMLVPTAAGNRHYAEIVKQGIDIADYVAPAATWEENRVAAYGKIGDQLDLQYHDLADGTETWRNHVAAVKAAHPKPI